MGDNNPTNQPHTDATKDKRNADDPIESHDAGEMYDVDPEKLAANESPELPKLQRRLKSRHLQMIAIGEQPKLPPFT